MSIDSQAPRESEGHKSVLLWLLILTVAIAPLPLGSNRPLPSALLCLAVATLLSFWSISTLISGQLAISPRRIAVPLLFYGLVCFWIFLQWLPMPLEGWGDPIWLEASSALGTTLPGRISVNPYETMTGLMRLLSYAAIFWLAMQLTRNPEDAQRAFYWVATIGAAYAIYGIVIYLMGNDWILLQRKWAYFDSLTSTMVNRNSFATFAGLCLLPAMALLLARIKHILILNRSAGTKFAMLVERLAGKSSWITVCVFSIGIALILTNSRAGIGATAIALLVLLLFHLKDRAINIRQMITIIAVIAALAGGILVALGSRLSERTEADDLDASLGLRMQVYNLVVDAVELTPWTGTGFGTFENVFPAYLDNQGNPAMEWDKAHNSYLENALELGVPAAIALNFALLWLAIRAGEGALERRRNRIFPAIGLAASILVGLHSMLDFSLQIPAIAALYAFIMGVAISQSWRSAD